jgi:tRNA(Ile)-lysidine synthase
VRSQNISVLAVKAKTEYPFDRHLAELQDFSKIALAVSGGSDSAAMLHLVAQWAARQNSQISLTVLSVDHGLRPEAAFECAQVGEWCKVLGLNHVTLQWLGNKPSSGIQAKARLARYSLMTEWCLENNVPVLLTAHTADDQAETIVMRQSRTSTAKSLAGIWPSRDWNGVQVMRPLLSVRRQELREYLIAQNLDWIDDPSNFNPLYERVRIREKLAGNADVAKSAAQALSAIRATQQKAEGWVAAFLSVSKLGLLSCDRGKVKNIDPDVGDEILALVFKVNGIAHLPELKSRQSLWAWLIGDLPNRRTLGGLIFAKRKHDLLIAREPGRISEETIVIPSSGKVVWDGRFIVKGPEGAEIRPAGKFEDILRRSDIPAFVDAGLPVVCNGRAVLAAPFHGIGAGVKAEFIDFKPRLSLGITNCTPYVRGS